MVPTGDVEDRNRVALRVATWAKDDSGWLAAIISRVKL